MTDIDIPSEQPGGTLEAKTVKIPDGITIHDLASLMDINAVEVIKTLMRHGHMLTINEVVSNEVASKIATSLGFEIDDRVEDDHIPASLVIRSDNENESHLEPRPPVVTILGHVDHGKTTLLDTIRNTNVVSHEIGGITQHIGAYQIESKGKRVTFLDTPGHEAFTAMRARGAQVTDIGVLVVAADDGIMPQTVEAIDHVKAAGVPVLVAINKVDRPNANPEMVKRQLSEHGLLIEEWGGDVISTPVSALTGDGIDDLLENILIVAEMSDLKANPQREARGVVVEARTDKRRGPLATVLIQTGTIKIGDNIVAGQVKGRVKAMLNDRGDRLHSAGPSEPLEILGLDSLPQAGDILTVVPNAKSARDLTESYARKPLANITQRISLESIFSKLESGEVKSLNLIAKTDLQGSTEAIRTSLERLSTDSTKVKIIRLASGSITENDILLAMASDAIIIGFNTNPEPGANVLANRESIDIRLYNVIYNLIDDVEKALQGMLTPVLKDVIEGTATVRATFNIGRKSAVAGIYVSNGRIARGTTIHVIRDGAVLFHGQIASLKHFKDDVREIGNGLEGGIALEGFNEYVEGDLIEAHREVET